MKKSEKKLETHTYKFFTLVNFFGMKRHPLRSVQKRQNQRFQKYVFRSILTTHFVFFVQSAGILFSFRNFARMWKCICVCLQFVSEFFIMFYYFVIFVKNKRSMWARVPLWISVNIYKLSTYMTNFIVKYQFFCSVQKR